MRNGIVARNALVLLAVVVVLAGGCRSLTGRTADRWVDDKVITAAVKTKLAAVRAKTLTRINVDTYDGTVYLSGVVDSEELRGNAEAVAWSVDGVQLVVANLQIRDGVVGAASPATGRPRRAAAGTVTSSLLGRLRGLARLEGDAVRQPRGPFIAYDRTGRLVATVYTVTMRDLALSGLDRLEAGGRRIEHVAIYPVVAQPDVPDSHYHVVLWHLPAAEASSLR